MVRRTSFITFHQTARVSALIWTDMWHYGFRVCVCLFHNSHFEQKNTISLNHFMIYNCLYNISRWKVYTAFPLAAQQLFDGLPWSLMQTSVPPLPLPRSLRMNRNNWGDRLTFPAMVLSPRCGLTGSEMLKEPAPTYIKTKTKLRNTHGECQIWTWITNRNFFRW